MSFIMTQNNNNTTLEVRWKRGLSLRILVGEYDSFFFGTLWIFTRSKNNNQDVGRPT